MQESVDYYNFYQHFTGAEEEPPAGVAPPKILLDADTWNLSTPRGVFAAGPQRMVHAEPADEAGQISCPEGISFVYGDVRALLASPNFDGALFQTASNFCGLEYTYREQKAERHRISFYYMDTTQGPAVQMATLPQLLSRYHFGDPGGVDMLSGLQRPYNVRASESGWSILDDASPPGDEAVGRVGSWLVERADVVLGPYIGGSCNFAVPAPPLNRVSLLLCAAHDMAYPADPGCLWPRVFLRAAYLNLFSAADSLGCGKVVMTLLGTGAFNNPGPEVARAIAWAAVHTRWTREPPHFYINLFAQHNFFPELDSLSDFFKGTQPGFLS
jgi:hypothetical protein